jgi:hypothetical protein
VERKRGVVLTNDGKTEKVIQVRRPGHNDHNEYLGWAYAWSGRSKESEAMHEHMLGIHKRELGIEHPQTLMSMHNLAHE